MGQFTLLATSGPGAAGPSPAIENDKLGGSRCAFFVFVMAGF